jgi:hypothetical protein
MTVETPKIDSRSREDIVEDARSLAKSYLNQSSADYKT